MDTSLRLLFALLLLTLPVRAQILAPVNFAGQVTQGTVATPSASPGTGSYSSAQTVTLTDGTSGATIYYTTDGTTPTTSSSVYSSPLTISTTTTLKAIGAKTGLTNSTVATWTYTISGGGGSTPSLVQGPFASPNDVGSQSPAYGTNATIKECLGRAAQVGNTIVLKLVTGGTLGNLSVSDGSNTYTLQVSQSGGGSTTALYTAPVTTATSCVTVTSSSGTFGSNQMVLSEYTNVGAVDVTCHASVTSGTTLACASMTPTVNGDLIINFAHVQAFSSRPTGSVTLTAASGWTANLLDGTDWTGVQSEVQSTAAAISPTITSSASVTQANVVGIALKAASSGGGYSGIQLLSSQRQNPSDTLSAAPGASQTFQFPCYGNDPWIGLGWQASSSTSPSVSSITDSNGNTWTGLGVVFNAGDSGGYSIEWFHVTSTVTCNAAENPTITWSATPAYQYVDFYDVANSNGYDSGAACSGASTGTGYCVVNSTSTSTTTIAGATITPTTSNGLILSFFNQDYGSIEGVSVGNFLPIIETCPGVSGGCGGGGTGTYASQAYQGSGADQDGGISDYYNSTTAAQTFTWTYANTQSQGIGAFFTATVALKGITPLAACDTTTVQNALNAVAANNTVIALPACSVNWGTAVSLSTPYSITLEGQSSVATTNAQGNPATFTDSTTITDTQAASHGPALTLIATGSASQVIRISGLTFAAPTNPAYNGEVKLASTSSTPGSLRLDHSHFININDLAVEMDNPVKTALADHNIFDVPSGDDYNGIRVYNKGGDGYGNTAWANGAGWGTAAGVFFENNTFNYGFMNDCALGGYFIARYNTFNIATGNINIGIQSHGVGSQPQNQRGCLGWEVYGNTVAGGGTISSSLEFQTSGTGFVWGNNIPSGNVATGSHDVVLNVNRVNANTYAQVATPNGWGYCGTAYNGTGSCWDGGGASASNGYPCLDQIGRGGPGNLLSGTFPTLVNTTTSSCSWPNETLTPVYIFDENFGGSASLVSVSNGQVTANVDYYAPVSSFTGATGTGYGLYSAIPGTCTAGVGYWATDQQKFYTCGAGNVWSLDYTPYTYPHPLNR